MRLASMALSVSLAPWVLVGLVALVATMFPIVAGHRDPAAGVALLVLSCAILLAWPLGLGLSIYANRAAGALESTPRTVARVALGVSIVMSLLMSLVCVGSIVLVGGLSLR